MTKSGGSGGEAGMVQYGTDPVYTERTTTYREYDRGSRSRSRSRHRRHSSGSDDQRHKSRSRSRVRDIAGAAAGTAAAAIGIKQYQKRKEKKEAERERERRRYEEEPSSNYYARDYPDDGYSPSPPHASGGSYYPQNNQFPPPPAPGFAQHPNISTPNVAQPPIPPYNPADYAGQAPPAVPHDNYGYPPAAPRAGDNVSSSNNLPRQSPAVNAPHAPMSAARVIYTPPSSPELGFERPHNKSVTFAPLSPISSRRLDKVRKAQSGDQDNLHPSSNDHSSPTSSQDALIRNSDSSTDHIYDVSESSPYVSGSRRRRHRRRRRNSDPSSDRPSRPTHHRRRRRNSSRSPSPTSDSDETVVLPDRFDRDGRLIERGHSSRKTPESEMVERVVHSFGDVVEGRKTWKDMLKELVESSQGMDSGSDRGVSDHRRR
ncbi:hypothetical protein BGZ60DRAFT_264545 [Tricladium varicosporioides]|nr:hypothetical protein BGZ60DRAFT_264545 [Hymenoscyphus varicosporioides]